jgi:NAD(P)-dependent dehydrogenase (short-subunit alcohol dehydrogenase family)
MTATFDFSGRAVLVTGGTSGIGLAIARGFRDAGAEVAITGTRAGPGDYDEELSGLAFHRADMADLESLPALAAALPRLDVLVNNAGTAVREDPLSAEAFERTIDINLNSVYRLCHLFHDRLKAGPGSIVNIASMTSYFASPRVPGYGASKAGVLQLTKTLGALYAPDGIRVNAIAPGWIETRLTAAIKDVEAISRPIVERTPMGRWGLPEEIAGAALFLASNDAAGFVTGVTVPVDGGYSSL